MINHEIIIYYYWSIDPTVFVQSPEQSPDTVKFSALEGMIMLFDTPCPIAKTPARCVGSTLV